MAACYNASFVSFLRRFPTKLLHSTSHWTSQNCQSTLNTKYINALKLLLNANKSVIIQHEHARYKNISVFHLRGLNHVNPNSQNKLCRSVGWKWWLPPIYKTNDVKGKVPAPRSLIGSLLCVVTLLTVHSGWPGGNVSFRVHTLWLKRADETFLLQITINDKEWLSHVR